MKLQLFRLTLLLIMATAAYCPMARGATSSASLPPFVYTGRITSYDGSGYDSIASGAEIRARKEGALIARSKIVASTGDTAANYTLVIPMSLVDTATAAVKGDKLTFEIDPNMKGTDVFTATNVFVEVGNPGRIASVNVRVASCTNPWGVADQYLEDIESYMQEYGYTSYDPNADWDGDGVSNYDEYLAGTDPFSAEDAGLKILAWKTVADNPDVMAATFLPGRNRAYSAIRRAPDSDEPFTLSPHQTTSVRYAEQKSYFVTGNEDPEVRTLYLLKEGAAALYRLKLE